MYRYITLTMTDSVLGVFGIACCAARPFQRLQMTIRPHNRQPAETLAQCGNILRRPQSAQLWQRAREPNSKMLYK